MSAISMIPPAADKILGPFSLAFTRPTAHRFLLVSIGLILTFGRHTVTAALWTIHILAVGHYSTYHRLFSRARWSLWALGRILATLILETLSPDEPTVVAIDDTNAQYRGKRVYGKGCHHDAVRSTHTHRVWRWGHRWIVLAIRVRLPFVSRPWALPVLMALYKPLELNLAEKHRHKTATVLARQLVATLADVPGINRIITIAGFARHMTLMFDGLTEDQPINISFAFKQGSDRQPEMTGAFHEKDNAIIPFRPAKVFQLFEKLFYAFKAMAEKSFCQGIPASVTDIKRMFFFRKVEAADQGIAGEKRLFQ